MGNSCNCLSNKEKINMVVNVEELQEESKNNSNDKIQNTTFDKKTPRGGNNPSQGSLKKNSKIFTFPITDDKKDNDIEKYPSKIFKIDFEEKPQKRIRDTTQINIVLLGDSNVGKSSFVIKYVSNRFETYHVVTLGTEIYNKKVKFNEIEYTLNFIVTSGVPEFQEDYTKRFQTIDFFILMYDITNKKSFEKLKFYLSDIKKYFIKFKDESSNVILVGNKFEMKNREIKLEESILFCKQNNLGYFEASVKNGININKIINNIISNFNDFIIHDNEKSDM